MVDKEARQIFYKALKGILNNKRSSFAQLDPEDSMNYKMIPIEDVVAHLRPFLDHMKEEAKAAASEAPAK